MELAYRRWNSEVIKIVQDVADSHFVAFDLEFSGISGPSQQRVGKPTLQELYEETRVAALKYQILQVGLTVVKEDVQNGQYIVKPYNFNISPIPTLRERQFSRDWSMSSGAVQFLLKNRFDFGLPFTDGIPYLSRAEEIQARLKMSGEEDRKRPDMILKPEDDNLIKHIRASITKWQEEPEESKENYLNIPSDDRGKGVPGVLNRYQMRLTHQIIQNEYPGLKTTSMREFVQVTNPSQEERNRIKTFLKEQIDREIGRAVGFRWILEALAGKDISGMPDECFLAAVSEFGPPRDRLTPFQGFVTDLNTKLRKRRRVLVGHNCFTDLLYLHKFFLGELPERVEDFTDSINDLFPALIDTKHIASFGSGRWGDTSLQSVEEELQDEIEPKIVIPPEFDRYSFNEKPHEAGYDALLTANIAIKLSAKMEREGVYHDEKVSKSADPQTLAQKEPFGAKDDGYVTASEDPDSHSSEKPAPDEFPDPTINTPNVQPSEANTSTNKNEDLLIKEAPFPNPPPQTTVPEPNTLIAVKERKPKPRRVDWNTTSEVEKVRNAFTATNIYDVLGTDIDGGADSTADPEADLLSFSDPDSPARTIRALAGRGSQEAQEQKTRIDDLVKNGKLMPRWDGNHGFWQIFGNKLQVNSCKEGVCNL